VVRARDAFEPVLDHTDDNAVAAMALILGDSLDPAEVRAVRQSLLAGQPEVLLDPPQKFSAGCPRLIPKLKSVEVPIGQAQHPLAQGRQDVLRQRDLAGPHSSHLGAKQDVRPVLNQRDEAKLGESTRPPLARRAPEGRLVLPLVGDIQSAAVKAHQAPSAYQAPLVDSTAIGFTSSSCSCRIGFRSKPGTSLRDPRFSSHLHACSGSREPLNGFQEAAQYLAVGRLHVRGRAQ